MKKILILSTSILAFQFGMVFGEEIKVQPISFTIKTVRLDTDGNVVSILTDARLSSITPIGRGDSADIECDGISDENGVIACVVNQCDEDSVLSNSYQINIKPPSAFGVVTPARVRVSKCKVTPAPASAGFMDRVLIAEKVKKDVDFVLSGIEAASAYPDDALFIKEYTKRMTKILEQPTGQLSAQRLRKIIQDKSYTAVKNKDQSTAIAYSDLTIAHANLLLVSWANNNDVQGVDLSKAAAYSTLNKNIKSILDSSKDDTLVSDHTKQLKFLIKSVNNGVLANEQFETLEKFIIEK